MKTNSFQTGINFVHYNSSQELEINFALGEKLQHAIASHCILCFSLSFFLYIDTNVYY